MSDKRIYEEIVRIHQTGGAAALVTVVGTEGSTPRKAGAKMLVYPDGHAVGTIGGGCIDRRVYSEVARVFEEGRPRLCRYELDGEIAAEMGMICGGRMEVFVELIDAEPRVVLFGGGHVGKVVAHLCALVGFKVTVVDDREEFAKAERFPDAHEVVLEAFARAGERVGRYGAPYVVVVTRGHAHDHEVLAQVLRENTRYVGVLGSKHKIGALFQALVKAGIPEERVAEVRSPIGLDLGAQTPEEIALAICAELVAVRYGRAGGPLCDTRDAPRGRPIPEEPGPAAAVATALAPRPREAAGPVGCAPGCCPSGDDPPGGATR
jgi:xanthine dehydrogenase accessory factor